MTRTTISLCLLVCSFIGSASFGYIQCKDDTSEIVVGLDDNTTSANYYLNSAFVASSDCHAVEMDQYTVECNANPVFTFLYEDLSDPAQFTDEQGNQTSLQCVGMCDPGNTNSCNAK